MMASVTSNNRYRIEQLEKKYYELDKKIDEIMTNHLPHINISVSELKTRINLFTAINIGAIILVAVLQKVLG